MPQGDSAILRNRNHQIVLFVLLLLACYHSSARGDEIVFCTPNYDGQRIFKISHAVLEEALSRIGHKFSLVTYPTVRCPIEVDSGNIAGDAHRIFNFNAQNEYPNLIRVEESIQTIDQSVFTKNLSIRPAGWESIKQYEIIYYSGIKIIASGLKKANIPTENIVPVFSHEKAFQMLATNRGDLVIVNSNTGNYFLKKLGLGDSGIKILKPPLVTFALYPYMHKKHKKLAKELASTIKDMKKEGEYQKLINSHP